MSYNDWTLSYKKILRTFPNLPNSTIRYMPIAIGFLGFLGFLDALYITIIHYKNAIPPCTLHGCETVLTSSYATIAGIPISLIGMGYYLVVIVLVGLLLTYSSGEAEKSKDNSSRAVRQLADFPRTISTWLILLTGVGLFVGILLVILQAFVLHAFCQYCLASEVVDFLLFDCAWWMWRKAV